MERGKISNLTSGCTRGPQPAIQKQGGGVGAKELEGGYGVLRRLTPSPQSVQKLSIEGCTRCLSVESTYTRGSEERPKKVDGDWGKLGYVLAVTTPIRL